MPENAIPELIVDLKDPKSFEKIYNLYWDKVYAVCYNNTREAEPAREMVQDIFKSLWERREQLTITHSIGHYLVRAAKLKVFEFVRNKTSQLKHEACALQDYCGSANCTEEDVMFNHLAEQVSLLVDRLPCQCRNVFRMSRVEGLSNKEIASALLVSERAVEQHITKALRFLRENLSEYAV